MSAPVVDPVRAQCPHRVGVARGSRSDDLDSGGPGQLDEYGADAAVGSVYENRRTGRGLGHSVQHLPGGDPVDDEGFGFGRVEFVGHRHQIVRVDQQVTAPPADLGQRGDPRAQQRGGDLRADGHDFTDEVVARHERERWLVVVLPAPHLLFGEGDAGGEYAHQRLSALGPSEFAGPELETVGVDLSGQDDFQGGDAVGGHVLSLCVTGQSLSVCAKPARQRAGRG